MLSINRTSAVCRLIITCIVVIGFVSTSYGKLILLHIDNTHSSVQFSVPFAKVTEVSGHFERFCGTFYLDDQNMSQSKLELFIDAASVNTALKIRDKDLRNDYLQVGAYPIIHFKSTIVRLLGTKQFEVQGQLFIHGKTKNVNLKLSIVGDLMNDDGGRELGLKLQPVALNKMDFDVMQTSNTVGDSITVTAMIRVRDLSPYRKDFDLKNPDSAKKFTISASGKYVASDGTAVALMRYEDHDFVSYQGDEWMWLSELRSTKENIFKTTSFNYLFEIKNGGVVLSDDQKSQDFKKEN